MDEKIIYQLHNSSITKENCIARFNEIFNRDPKTYAYSPGRINLIGEHVDYQNGIVFPAAINKYIYGAAAATITLTGSRFKPRGKISIKIVDENGSGVVQETTPTVVLTDDSGNFTGVTFATDASTIVGSYVILATDKVNYAKRNFTVTS